MTIPSIIPRNGCIASDPVLKPDIIGWGCGGYPCEFRKDWDMGYLRKVKPSTCDSRAPVWKHESVRTWNARMWGLSYWERKSLKLDKGGVSFNQRYFQMDE